MRWCGDGYSCGSWCLLVDIDFRIVGETSANFSMPLVLDLELRSGSYGVCRFPAEKKKGLSFPVFRD